MAHSSCPDWRKVVGMAEGHAMESWSHGAVVSVEPDIDAQTSTRELTCKLQHGDLARHLHQKGSDSNQVAQSTKRWTASAGEILPMPVPDCRKQSCPAIPLPYSPPKHAQKGPSLACACRTRVVASGPVRLRLMLLGRTHRQVQAGSEPFSLEHPVL